MSIAPWNSFGSHEPLANANPLPHRDEVESNGEGKINGHGNSGDEEESHGNGHGFHKDFAQKNGKNGNGHHEDSRDGNDHANGQQVVLHRLGVVRRQQGVSQRNIARRLNVDINTVREQEEEGADLPLSMLYRWQKILEVPISELLVDSDAPLSPPVLERARMIKVMKTVAAIAEKAQTAPMQRLLQMLCTQLLEIMPELTDVAPWHTVGQRRTLDEYGRVVERQLPDDMFRRRGS